MQDNDTTNTVDDDDFEIEVVADEEVKDPPKEAEPAKADGAPEKDDDADEDLESYGEKVKKRINKEVWKRREAERQAAEAKARLDQLNKQLQGVQQRAQSADQFAIQSQEQAIEADYLQTQQAYKRAYDEGDTDAMFAATEKLADIRLRKRQVEDWKSRSAQPQRQTQPVQQQPQADPRAVDWASRNDWFGKDPIKTGAAYALDAELKSRGVDPRSDAYYEELDRRLAEAFPDIRKAPQKPRQTPSQPVAGVNTRTAGSEKRKVTLTASEAAMAERLGVPLAEYARYLKRA